MSARIHFPGDFRRHRLRCQPRWPQDGRTGDYRPESSPGLSCGKFRDRGDRAALIIIRCGSDDQAVNRIRELNEQLDILKSELVARRQVERGLVGALKARDDFVGIAAHELRNPLNVFHLTLQLLYRMPQKSGNDIRGILDKLRVQLNRINSLVDHLLDVTRIRAGKLELELEKFDLSELIKEIVRRYSELHPDIPLMVRVNGAAAGTWDR